MGEAIKAQWIGPDVDDEEELEPPTDIFGNIIYVGSTVMFIGGFYSIFMVGVVRSIERYSDGSVEEIVVVYPDEAGRVSKHGIKYLTNDLLVLAAAVLAKLASEQASYTKDFVIRMEVLREEVVNGG